LHKVTWAGTAPRLGRQITPHWAFNALNGSAFFPAEDYIGDTNPDGARQVNMDWTPTYYTEETNIQLQFSHDFGNIQMYYAGGYTESEVNSTEGL
jgi:hypothetical protein